MVRGKLYNAKELPNIAKLGLSRITPYVSVGWTQQPNAYVSSMKNKEQNPEWGEDFAFLTEAEHAELLMDTKVKVTFFQFSLS